MHIVVNAGNLQITCATGLIYVHMLLIIHAT